MDYRELVEQLRSIYAIGSDNPDKDNPDYCEGCSMCDAAADAIETLLAERDAMMEDLRGYCRTCVHANTGKEDFPCIKCKHLEFYGTQEIDGWAWRGPQKEPTP